MARFKWHYIGRVLTLGVCFIMIQQGFKHFDSYTANLITPFQRDSSRFILNISHTHTMEINEMISEEGKHTCLFPDNTKIVYPFCQEKIQWMNDHWKDDQCLSDFGVDGSICSFRAYLSEIENYCPPIRMNEINRSNKFPRLKIVEARMNFDIDGLLTKLENPPFTVHYDWLRQRIRTMWTDYVDAGKKLQSKLHQSGLILPKRRIFLYLGLLSSRSGFGFAAWALNGGPLGELVQWSNLISSLYILGHNITIASETEHITRHAVGLDRLNDPQDTTLCNATRKFNHTLIFTDIIGWKTLKNTLEDFEQLKCLVRILDSFGTDPAFNYKPYSISHSFTTDWSEHNFNIQQIYTMFPSSPDNTFLGFAVKNPLSQNETATSIMEHKKHISVLWGKNPKYFTGKEKYISTFQKFIRLYATVSSSASIPTYVHNHGVLNGSELISLLKQSKLFIGLSEPIEGTAPLEALALGNVYFNPKYIPPHNRDNSKAYREKPTRRKVTSQQPYAEMFIGPPNVHTVDIKNQTQVRNAIKQALSDIDSGRVKPYLPFEFTYEGLLQRISYLISKQNFCTNNTEPWIPRHAIIHVDGKRGESCQDACRKKGLICEPSHFNQINDKSKLETLTSETCKSISAKEDIYYPAYDTISKSCILQKEPMLFSCVGERSRLTRICPCRNFIPQQTAICEKCFI